MLTIIFSQDYAWSIDCHVLKWFLKAYIFSNVSVDVVRHSFLHKPVNETFGLYIF